MIAYTLLITCILAIGYVYLGYPVIIWCLSFFFGKPVKKGNVDFSLNVSIVISAYNESNQVRRKIANLIEVCPPLFVKEIIIASDGSTDDMESRMSEIINEYQDKIPIKINYIHFDQRRGKASVLNDVIPRCRGNIVMLMDVRQTIVAGAIEALLSNFNDPAVGIVSGELVFRNTGGTGEKSVQAAQSMGVYWRYEKFIRRRESILWAVPGATGALYAIRRELFKPIPSETLLDDVAIPMQATARGYRCIFEDKAIVYDVPSNSITKESIRKRRTLAGNLQLVLLYPQWLLPWCNPIFFQWMSHKLGRMISPFLLAGCLCANMLCLADPCFLILFILQVIFYSMALIGLCVRKQGWWWSMINIAAVFLYLNILILAAFKDVILRNYSGVWEKST